jgi:hypothetical protein
VNGLRICGAARQSSIGWSGEPGYPLKEDKIGKENGNWVQCASTHGKKTDAGATWYVCDACLHSDRKPASYCNSFLTAHDTYNILHT